MWMTLINVCICICICIWMWADLPVDAAAVRLPRHQPGRAAMPADQLLPVQVELCGARALSGQAVLLGRQRAAAGRRQSVPGRPRPRLSGQVVGGHVVVDEVGHPQLPTARRRLGALLRGPQPGEEIGGRAALLRLQPTHGHVHSHDGRQAGLVGW